MYFTVVALPFLASIVTPGYCGLSEPAATFEDPIA